MNRTLEKYILEFICESEDKLRKIARTKVFEVEEELFSLRSTSVGDLILTTRYPINKYELGCVKIIKLIDCHYRVEFNDKYYYLIGDDDVNTKEFEKDTDLRIMRESKESIKLYLRSLV